MNQITQLLVGRRRKNNKPNRKGRGEVLARKRHRDLECIPIPPPQEGCTIGGMRDRLNGEESFPRELKLGEGPTSSERLVMTKPQPNQP